MFHTVLFLFLFGIKGYISLWLLHANNLCIHPKGNTMIIKHVPWEIREVLKAENLKHQSKECTFGATGFIHLMSIALGNEIIIIKAKILNILIRISLF